MSQWEDETVNVLALMSHTHKISDESEIKVYNRGKA